MPRSDIEEQLTKHLADVHAIEEQALAQMRRAPGIAGSDALRESFERHLGETEEQERRVRELLEARDAEPSALKDVAARAGGMGMVFFARLNPDTPGKLVAHAYSYEHMEIAAYELLAAVGERAGASGVVEAAQAIAAEEREMAARLADGFDDAVAASLEEADPGDLGGQLDKYLADAHAIEAQAAQMLSAAPRLVTADTLRTVLAEHAETSRQHRDMVAERLEARGASPSRFEDAGMRIGALNIAGFFAAQPDTAPKLAGFAFAFEHLEIAAYELLRRVAERAGDDQAATLASAIIPDERLMASRLEDCFGEALAVSLSEKEPTG